MSEISKPPNWRDAALAFESEANQTYCELALLRGECMRLRELNSTLSGFIEQCHRNGEAEVPEHIALAMEAVFPPDVAEIVAHAEGMPTVISANDFHSAVAALWQVAKLLECTEVRIHGKDRPHG